MNKKEAMYCMVGMLRGFIDCDKTYRTVKVGEFLGEKYNKYELSMTNCDTTVGLLDTKAPKLKDLRRRVIEINRELDIDKIVHLLLEALAYDIKNN